MGMSAKPTPPREGTFSQERCCRLGKRARNGTTIASHWPCRSSRDVSVRRGGRSKHLPAAEAANDDVSGFPGDFPVPPSAGVVRPELHGIPAPGRFFKGGAYADTITPNAEAREAPHVRGAHISNVVRQELRWLLLSCELLDDARSFRCGSGAVRTTLPRRRTADLLSSQPRGDPREHGLTRRQPLYGASCRFQLPQRPEPVLFLRPSPRG